MTPSSPRTPLAQLVRSLIFCALVASMLAFVGVVVKPARRGNTHGNPWPNYLALEKNSVDAVFFGTSHVFTGVDPGTIWRSEGIPSFVLGGPMQNLEVTRYYVQEAMRTQRPKVVAVEMVAASYPEKRFKQRYHQLNVGYMPLGASRVGAALFATPKGERTGVLFDPWLYHSRWAELTKEDFDVWGKHAGFEFLKGYLPRAGGKSVPTTPSAALDRPVGEPRGVVAYHLPALRAIARECAERDIELLLFLTPTGPPGQYSYHLRTSAKALAGEFSNVRVLDLSEPDAVPGLSYERDFFDKGHLNHLGAEKTSRVLAGYLAETYGLTDRRGAPAYRSWHKDVARRDAYVEKLERRVKRK